MIHNIGFSDYGWDDLRVPLTAGRIGVGSPPGFEVLTGGVQAYMFSPSFDEQLYFETQMPHDCQCGSTIYPHVHWCGTDTESNVSVSWGLEYVITSVGNAVGSTTTVYGNTPVSGNTDVTNLLHEITPMGSGINMSAFTGLSAVLTCRVFRNTASAGASIDNYGDDAAGLSVDFHYKRNSLGSASPT